MLDKFVESFSTLDVNAAEVAPGRRSVGTGGTHPIRFVLGTDWSTKADQWLREVMSAKATAASKAMDAEYLRTHIGGGWHRLFDGGHDLWGAFKATKQAAMEVGFLHHLGVYAHDLWKDLATPNGLPVFTWENAVFDALTNTLHDNLHVSSAWVQDMACFTATELGGAVAAIAAMLFNLKATDPHRYFEMCGSLGVSAVVAANPVWWPSGSRSC